MVKIMSVLSVYEYFKGKYYCATKDLTVAKGLTSAFVSPDIRAMMEFYSAGLERLSVAEVIKCFADVASCKSISSEVIGAIVEEINIAKEFGRISSTGKLIDSIISTNAKGEPDMLMNRSMHEIFKDLHDKEENTGIAKEFFNVYNTQYYTKNIGDVLLEEQGYKEECQHTEL